MVGVVSEWAWPIGRARGVAVPLVGPAGVASSGRSCGHRAPVRGPGHRESRWGWEGAWEVPPGISPSRAASAGGGRRGGPRPAGGSLRMHIPAAPSPPQTANPGKGGEPSRAMAPLGEYVPVSPRRTLSPSHCPIHPHTVGKALPVVFPHSSPLLSQLFSCSRSAAGSRGTDGLGWGETRPCILSWSESSPPNHHRAPQKHRGPSRPAAVPSKSGQASPDQHLPATGKANLMPEKVSFLLNGEKKTQNPAPGWSCKVTSQWDLPGSASPGDRHREVARKGHHH